MINIAGMNKAEVLAKLYNASKPVGNGHLFATDQKMTVDDAQKIIDTSSDNGGDLYFDYLHGRVMKIDLAGDQLDPFLYDRDNGGGAAARAIAAGL